MQVKIGDKIYDANDQPIMIIMSEMDKMNIRQMHQEATKYVCFPESMSPDEIQAYMDRELDNGNGSGTDN